MYNCIAILKLNQSLGSADISFGRVGEGEKKQQVYSRLVFWLLSCVNSKTPMTKKKGKNQDKTENKNNVNHSSIKNSNLNFE